MNMTGEERFSEKNFWQKLKKYAKAIGCTVICKALILFYTLDKPDLPSWVRATIYGALIYFIVPMDAISDFIPAVGYSDDLGVLAYAISMVLKYITPVEKEKARAKAKELFDCDCQDSAENERILKSPDIE
jgi:uncharacterized membrane protein YkvA (DUF1232 family)